MANGRFSRGATVIANASLAFVGNIFESIEQLVNSPNFDLFKPLPETFNLAVMDRFHTYLPGWEIPKNSSDYLTHNYGFITDYLAESFHYLAKRVNRYEYVNGHCKFGRAIQGRDEVAVKKTLCAILKLLHPAADPTPAELEEYMTYALEGRRRVKEQMNKRTRMTSSPASTSPISTEAAKRWSSTAPRRPTPLPPWSQSGAAWQRQKIFRPR